MIIEFKIKDRVHDPDWEDSTTTERQRKRNKQLNAKAKAAGYAGWSEYATAVINGSAIIPKHSS